jgi:undecaprenyl diphosphate synthase
MFRNQTNIPRHIAIIPDGNRRWARRRGLTSEVGHRHGFLNVTPELFRNAWQNGVHTMTLWLFSTENWNRSTQEVDYLMSIYTTFVAEMCDLCLELDVRIAHLGRKDRLPTCLRLALLEAIKRTSNCESGVFNIALDYGGRDEIVRGIARLLRQGNFNIENLDENIVDALLDTAGQEFPEPDIILRTSGEMRMSGFMPWQSTYSEFFFIDECYPDLTWEMVAETISDFSGRNRRFGGDLASTSQNSLPLISIHEDLALEGLLEGCGA